MPLSPAASHPKALDQNLATWTFSQYLIQSESMKIRLGKLKQNEKVCDIVRSVG